MSDASAYWKANIRLVAICLVIWFIVSFLFGIILVDALNTITLGGYKLAARPEGAADWQVKFGISVVLPR